MEGKKTWVGIIITVLGFLGLGDVIAQDQVGQAIDLIVQLVGIVITIYGNYKAHQKIKTLSEK